MNENVQKVVLTADDRTRAAFASFRTNVEKTDASITKLQNASALLKRGLGVIGVGFSVTSVISSASDMETALVGVSKTTGLVGQELADFSASISQVSTRIPVTTGELLELAQAAGQMGVSGAQNLEKFSVTVAKLGRASDLSGEQAAKSLARILNVTGESVDSVDTLASVIVSLGNNVAASESEIARMTNEVTRSTAAFDVSSAEAAAMAAAMASIGIQAELGGTSVGAAMQEITSRVQAGGKDLEEFASVLNLNSKTLTDLFAENKTEAFQFFLRAVGELGLDAGNALDEVGLGGRQLLKTLIPLANNTEILTETLKLANAEVREATALDREFEASLKTLNSQWEVSKNIVAGYAKTIGGVLVPALKSGLQAFNDFFGAGDISAIDSQIALISNLESKLESLKERNTGLDGVIPGASKVFGTNKKDFDLLVFQIETEKEKLEQLRDVAKELEDQLPKTSEAVSEITDLPSGGDDGDVQEKITEAQRFIDTLKKEEAQAGLTATEIRKLEAATLGVSKVADPLIDSIDKTNKELAKQKKIASQLDDDLRKIESITQSVRTEEEKFADTVEELDRLLEAGLGLDAHNRALQQAEDQLHGVGDTTRSITSEVDQLWTQAGRNIQSTLANSIFNFFDDGLKGMLNNVISTVGRIGSEFAALSLARGIGLGSVFAGGGAAIGAGASASGGGIGALNIASTGINAASLLNSGFGLNSILSKGAIALGDSFGISALSSFGAGLGTSATGVAAAEGAAALYGTTGLSTAAGLGSSFAAAAGPAIALFAVDQIGRLLAGNKSTGTIADKIPVIGGFAGALFGLGPAKFRQQFFGGNASEAGFQDGFVTDVFRRKGGLLRGNKHSQQDAQNADEILSLFDDSIKAFFGSTRALAENLNLDAQALDNLTLNVAIQSEKKKVISQEQISDELARLSDAIVGSVLPNVADFSKSGETAATTFGRISNQTSALTSVLTNFGQASDVARETVLGLSFDARDDLVGAFGGIESLSAKTQFFFDQAFTDAEKLGFATDSLSRSLTDLDVPVDITIEGFVELIKALDVTTLEGAETANALLELFPALVNVRDATDQLSASTNSLIEREKTLADLRADLTNTFRTEQTELQGVINKFNGFTDSLRTFKDSLLLGQLSPLTPGQKLSESRTQFNRTRALAAQGDENALRSLPEVSRTFLQASQAFNASSAAFTSDFNFVQSVLDSAGVSAANQSDIASQQLTELELTVSQLTNIDNSVIGVEQSIRDLTVAVLTGDGNSAIGGQEIRDYVSNFTGTTQELVNAAVKNDISGRQFSDATGATFAEVARATKGLSVTDKDISDFVNANLDNPLAIYNAAIENSIDSQRLIDKSVLTRQQVDDFVRRNNLAEFEDGTDFVPKTGLSLVHKGEAVTPSSVPAEIKLLRKEISQLREDQNRQTDAMINITMRASRSNAKTIANSNRQSDQSQEWRMRSNSRIR